VKKSSNHDMTDYHESARKVLLNAQQAMQRGERQAARSWTQQAIALDPDSEEPWLFLAALASPHASVNYLERALKINPGSQRAQKGMQWAEERLIREKAGQSSKRQTPSQDKVLENQDNGGTSQFDSGKPATSEPKTRPRAQKNPAQTVAPAAPSTDLRLPKSIAGTRWSRSLMRFSSRWQNWIGFLLVSLFIIVALAAPLISPNNPKSPGAFMKVRVQRLGDIDPYPPNMIPPLGTLPGQFDGFHALIWGARDALIFGLEVVILAACVGFLLGAIAGYAGGFLSSVLMRITDSFLAFPVIAGVVFLNQLWASAVVSVGGFAQFNINNQFKGWYLPLGATSPILALFQAINPLVLILVLFSWMPYARITHSIVVSLKQVEFIQAARAIGARPSRIIFRHLLPNSVSPSIVLAARDVGSMVILQATFTFIGLDGSSTWGKMLVLGKDWVLGPGGGIFAYWWVFVPATLVLVLFGIGWNLLGDGLSELLDPRDD
jgi:peptide/nickel transport system permease protein